VGYCMTLILIRLCSVDTLILKSCCVAHMLDTTAMYFLDVAMCWCVVPMSARPCLCNADPYTYPLGSFIRLNTMYSRCVPHMRQCYCLEIHLMVVWSILLVINFQYLLEHRWKLIGQPSKDSPYWSVFCKLMHHSEND